MKRTRGLIVAMVLAPALVLGGQSAHAAEIVVLSAAAMKTALTALSAAYTAQFGDKAGDQIRFIFGTAGFVRDTAIAGQAFDLAIAPPAVLADLATRGLVVAGSQHSLGEVRLGAAVRAGTSRPSIATPEAFKAAILAAESVGMADPATGATSGVYLARLMGQLGLTEALRPKLKLYPEGQVAMEAAARGEIGLGLGQISEILPVRGVDLIDPLPDSLQLRTVYAASVAEGAHDPEAAGRLLQFLQGPAAGASFEAQGFEAPH